MDAREEDWGSEDSAWFVAQAGVNVKGKGVMATLRLVPRLTEVMDGRLQHSETFEVLNVYS